MFTSSGRIGRRLCLALSLAFVLNLTGCSSCNDGEGSGPPITQLYPSLQLSQSELAFGQVKVGTYQFYGITIGNQGQATLGLKNFQWEANSREAFKYEVSAEQVAAGGEAAVLKIFYQPPGEGLDAGTLTFETDDPDHPTVRVHASGQGTIPDIQVDPTQLSFEGVTAGSQRTMDVYVENAGTGKLTINSISVPSEYASSWSVELPADYIPNYALLPDILLKLRVTYHPPAEAGDATQEGVLRIESDDPDEAFLDVRLTGTSVEPPPALAPVVECLAPMDGTEAYVGSPVLLQGKVSDNEDTPDRLVVYYFSSIDYKLSDPNVDAEGNVTLVTSDLSVGDHIISLFATDSRGQTGYCQLNLKVWNEETEWQYYIAGLNPDGSPNPERRFSIDDDIQIIRIDGVTGEQTFCLNDLDAKATESLRVTCNAHLGDVIQVIAYDIYADDAAVDSIALYFREEFQPIIPQRICVSTGRADPGDEGQCPIAACPESPYANEWKKQPDYNGDPPPPCEFARAEITVSIPSTPEEGTSSSRALR